MTSYNVVGGACLSKRQIQKRLIRILDAKRSLKKSFSIGGLSLLVGIAALLLLFSFRSESLASVPDSSLLFPTLQDDFGIIGTPDAVTIPLPGLPRDARPLEMVLIKAGSFIMGSTEKEKSRLSTDWPAHEVVIPQDFYIGKYEVTQAQWEAVAGKHRFYNRGRPNHPAEKVSWRFCQRFIKKLNALGLGIFRLPTEAEWEYACRAGTQTRFFFGNSLDRADEYMWWKGNNETNSTKEVGLKKPNLWGLYDMLGNVNEWCQDRWESPFTILWSNRVFRGGAYSSGAEKCRAAYRDYEQSMDYHYTIGFRLVMDVPENK